MIAEYTELMSTIGVASTEKFYRKLERTGESGSKNPNIVLPNEIDFVADVELALKAALNSLELGKVKAGISVEHDSKERAGRVFLARRIYPSTLYFRVPIGNTIQMCTCGNKEHALVSSATVWCHAGCGKNTLWHVAGMYEQHPVYGHTVATCVECCERQEEKLIKEINERERNKAA